MLSLNTIRQFIKAHPGKALLVGFVATLYIAFNIWIFFFSKSGGLKTNLVGNVTERMKSFGRLRETPSAPLGTSQSPKSSSPQRPTPTPTPTPRPTGPGDYACDPYGQCNLYSDEMRKQYCTKTFADSLCLNQCGEKTTQCTK